MAWNTRSRAFGPTVVEFGQGEADIAFMTLPESLDGERFPLEFCHQFRQQLRAGLTAEESGQEAGSVGSDDEGFGFSAAAEKIPPAPPSQLLGPIEEDPLRSRKG